MLLICVSLAGGAVTETGAPKSPNASGDGSWSRRYTGHLENGRDSVTG